MNRSVWAIPGLRFIAAASGAACVLLTAHVARADWQYTKWGMSVDEVIASSKGEMQRCESACSKLQTDDEVAAASGLYQSGSFEFKAFAYFNRKTGRLSSMLLYLRDTDQGFRLQDELKAKYGRPTSQTDVSISRSTIWLTDIDKIEFSLIYKAMVSLKYQPRVSASNKGL